MAARIVGGVLYQGPAHNTTSPDDGGGWPNPMPVNPPSPASGQDHGGNYPGPGSVPPPGGGSPGKGGKGGGRANSHGAPSIASWQREVRSGVRDLREKQRKNKEADRIWIRDLPTVRNKEPWLISLKTNVVVASGSTDDDNVTAWLAESCGPTRSWDNVLESGEEFMTLDVKPAAALLAFFKDDKTHVTETSQRILLLIDEQMDSTGKVAR